MKCPRDTKELELTSYDKASIYACSSCMGCWTDIDNQLLDVVIKDKVKRLTQKSDMYSGVECPSDGHRLLELIYEGISIDVCPLKSLVVVS
jgi:Zn-finger nucleic acid-binding protein